MEEEKQEEIFETVDYNGTFHERDSHAENNIVDEVKSSFLDYSMSTGGSSQKND